MKLYYTPGACSQAPHIALNELGLAYEPVKVDLVKHTLPDGTDFYSIVSIDLSPDGDGTLLQFLQTGFPDAQARIEHARGWPHALRVMSDALLSLHGVGTLWPKLPEKTHLDGVARDLEAARARLEQDTAK